MGQDPTAQLFPAVHGCHLNDRVFRDYLAPALKELGEAGLRAPCASVPRTHLL
ncbi:MAG TPA: hypothetical protein VE197_14250 [Mycobacterium sp.]|nr:hypothetical protein [Mycobacterium sp.]